MVPPASEELTSSQLEQLLKVQAAIRERLGIRFAEFEKQYKVFSEKDKATLTDVPTLIAGYRDLALMWLDAKRGQVEALNQVNLHSKIPLDQRTVLQSIRHSVR